MVMNHNIFAALNNGGKIILGKVINFSDKDLTFQSVSDGDVGLGSFHSLDIYSSNQFYFQNIQVEIVADDRFIDEKSFTKMMIRHLRVRYKKGGILRNISSEIYNFKSGSYPVIEKLFKWCDSTNDQKLIRLTEPEAQEIFHWMSMTYGSDA